MIKKIVIHSTGTSAEIPVTLEMIEEMNSQDRCSDPMPYHYIVNVDGKVLKGRADKEICGLTKTDIRAHARRTPL